MTVLTFAGAGLDAGWAAAVTAVEAVAGAAGASISCPKAMKCTHPDSDAAIGINSPITARMTDPQEEITAISLTRSVVVRSIPGEPELYVKCLIDIAMHSSRHHRPLALKIEIRPSDLLGRIALQGEVLKCHRSRIGEAAAELAGGSDQLRVSPSSIDQPEIAQSAIGSATGRQVAARRSPTRQTTAHTEGRHSAASRHSASRDLRCKRPYLNLETGLWRGCEGIVANCGQSLQGRAAVRPQFGLRGQYLVRSLYRARV